MNRIGTSIIPDKDLPGLVWEISEESIRLIKDLEEQQRVALAHFWHYYV